MHAVSATDLVLRHGVTTAIDRSTFLIPSGSVTVLIGPNGAGKSTLLNAIAGLQEISAGDLSIAGSAPGEARIAYVLQGTKVNEALPVTVREVVTMGRYASTGRYGRLRRRDRDAVDEAIERMGLLGMEEKHLGELSGGQRQRVFVAQGLAQEHDLLLLDEPLTGLDLVSAKAIDAVIHDEQAKGRTVLMTTHDLSEARVSDHVLLLAGRVVASGTPSEVLVPEHLATAYGTALLHVEGDHVFVDDPAHVPVKGRHVHGERSIHVESSPHDVHPGG